MARVRVHFDYESLAEAMATPTMAAMLSKEASHIANTVRQIAPINSKASWNAYARNISIVLWDDGFVPRAAVQADRHPMVVEYGWRNKWNGIKYPGRHPMKRALMRARIR